MKMRILAAMFFVAVVGAAQAVSIEVFPTNGGTVLPMIGSSSGPISVESQSGGPSGTYTIVFRFANPLTSVGGVQITNGIGKLVSGTIDSTDPRRYIVNLTGVANAQLLSVGLSNVVTTFGTTAKMTNTVGFLIGDTNGDGVVSSADIAQTKSQSGILVSAVNFREDINSDGNINSADIALVKSKSGTGIPNFAAGSVAPGNGVPDGGSTALLFGAALSIMACLGRRFGKVKV